MKVHISHVRNDFLFAKKLATELRRIGVQPNFLNLFEACGEVINNDYQALTKKMREFDYLIAIVSKEYLSSLWHPKELFAALLREQTIGHRFVIAIAIDDEPWPPFVSDPIKLENQDFDAAFSKVLGHIKSIPELFVIMKFGDPNLDSLYDLGISVVARSNGLEAIRVDRIQDSGKINEQTLRQLDRAAVVFADLTGERPNCYLEVGYALALGKEIILSAQQDTKIHFDLQERRALIWQSHKHLVDLLDARLKAIKARQGYQ